MTTDSEDVVRHEERLAAFSRERLGGRAVPADLRALLVAEWDGHHHGLDLTFLEPGAPSPLRDHSYLSETERADPEMQCIMAASDRMAEHVLLVAEGGKGWIGYWTHPDQPGGDLVPIELDTEAQFWEMDGACLAEAAAADVSYYDDEPAARYTAVIDRLTDLGVPVGCRDYSALDAIEYVVDPNELDEEYAAAEREKRGLP